MNYEALGNNISRYRKAKGMTQENLAEKLGVSAQAVSKWENGQSYPDISLLPELAKIFQVSMDDLFSYEQKSEVFLVPESERKSLDEMFLRVRVHSSSGDKVQVNMPAPLFKLASQSGMISFGSEEQKINFSQIDFDQLFKLMDQGVMGKLVEVETADGDTVEVYVE